MNKWEELKQYLEGALQEGYEQGYNIEDNSLDKGQFIAYQKVMDMVKKIEQNSNEK